MRASSSLLLLCLVAGCAKQAPPGFGPSLGPADDDEAATSILTTGIEPTGGGDDAPASATAPADASTSVDASSGGSIDPGSSGLPDASTEPVADASSSSGGGELVPGDPLDPSLDVPDDGEPCTTPGSLVECPGIAVCRFQTTEQGTCESCEPCGNLGDPCSEGSECDILFSCYDGRCTNFCELGTYACGPIEDCLDVGHPTHGVCDPAGI